MKLQLQTIWGKLPKRTVIIGAAILLIIICLVGWLVYHKSQTPAPGKIQPTFSTILPAGKTIDELGGWARNSPSDRAPAYAYRDTIDGTSISVTEQLAPASLQNDQIADLAEKANYSDKIQAGSTAAYIGTSAKGPQSAIFIRSNLFVTIKSDQKISDKSWVSYIKSLQ